MLARDRRRERERRERWKREGRERGRGVKYVHRQGGGKRGKEEGAREKRKRGEKTQEEGGRNEGHGEKSRGKKKRESKGGRGQGRKAKGEDWESCVQTVKYGLVDKQCYSFDAQMIGKDMCKQVPLMETGVVDTTTLCMPAPYQLPLVGQLLHPFRHSHEF